MALPAFVAAGTAVAGEASISLTWPTHQANDIGIMVIETGGEGEVLTPSGWSHVAGSPLTDVADDTGSRLHVLWRRADSTSETATDSGDSGDHQLGRIVVYRGCKTAGVPWDVVTTTTAAASSTATWPELTTTVDECLVLLIASRPNPVTQATHWGIPTGGNGLTTLVGGVEVGSVGSPAGHAGGLVVAQGEKLTAGATGNPTATKSASTTSALMTLALAPLAASGAVQSEMALGTGVAEWL